MRAIRAVTPLSAARYRDRYAVSRKKSDPTRPQYVRHPEAVADAMGLQLSALLLQLDAACRARST